MPARDSDATRIGSRWPSLRPPPPKVPAPETLASGRTGAGTEYELRFGARESRIRRSGWAIDLLLRRPDEYDIESGGGMRGRGRLLPPELHLSLTGSCGDPRESFLTGWAPPDVAAVALLTEDGRIEARLLDVAGQESRLVFAQIDGAPRVVAVAVTGRDGTTSRDELASPRDPCRGEPGGSFITWFGGPRA
jgi:hypothetical protein